MATQQRLLSGATALLGAWILASAFVYELGDSHYLNNIVVGAAIAALGAYALWRAVTRDDRRYALGLAALLGLWMIAVPFVLDAATAPSWSDIVSGLLVFALAGYDAYRSGRRAPTTRTEQEPAR
ncbi:SPW repeat domain-containing protein [Halobacterium wangiae]|uniref:SPW repeat domain-containing protein n=1 Tax=Halobacterium wangiae TaxID=2902623 RepID=UPI001E29EFA9|nr:SPW repeat protein [Halobacterium wangiae]